MDDHDTGYRLLFSHPEMVRDLLTGFVPESWVAELDLDTLEKVSGSYVTDDLRSRCDDVIWRVRWGKEWVYLYLLLEFQSTVDPYMAVRIMAYVALLYQDLIRTGQLGETGHLPPVVPVVLYNGRPRWQAATDIGALIFPVTGELARYQPRLHYLLLDEGRFDEQALAPLQNLVAALFRLENSRDAPAIQRVLRHLIDWLHAPQQASLRRSFTEWLRRVLLPGRLPHITIPAMQELQEVDDMLAERVKEWYAEYERKGLQDGMRKGMAQGLEKGLEKGLEQGLEKGLEKGRNDEARRILSRQITRRFGALSPATEARLAAASLEQLELWADLILDAQSPEALFGSNQPEPDRYR
ncbi:putative transposase [Isoalcanivorax pacificus W11-5]|uniref:Putative transposase n=1 Tax=Isoalcanivorax pacificus W11-5 TaxID=391936 RepID=A0A0B4XQC1_9GAMM|nr:Rpn family recombination-promoting nuclease/putative transposase [Isoalcanivorax pacificus]AJD48945.1 putative transposase [Isoalcanivorax pacificus W11-5]